MPTNLAIDDRLINQALRAGKHKTKREAVNAALDEYVRMHHRKRAVAAMGTIEFHDDLESKKSARRRGA